MRISLASLMIVAALADCYSVAAPLPIPPDIGTVTSAPAPQAYVPPGTAFRVRLNDDVGSLVSTPDQRFTALTVAPVYGTDGSLIIAAHAVVRGHVASVDAGDNPAVRINFDSVETVRGRVPLHATVRDLQQFPLAEAFKVADPSVTGYDAVLFPTFGIRSPVQIGGGPWPSVAGPPGGPTNRVFVPSGATLEIVLVQPLAV